MLEEVLTEVLDQHVAEAGAGTSISPTPTVEGPLHASLALVMEAPEALVHAGLSFRKFKLPDGCTSLQVSADHSAGRLRGTLF